MTHITINEGNTPTLLCTGAMHCIAQARGIALRKARAKSCRVRNVMLQSLGQSPGPIRQALEELADELFRCLVRQVSSRIKALPGITDHHLRLINRKHIEKDEYLSEMVLRRAVPMAPIEAPMSATGFPFHALSP